VADFTDILPPLLLHLTFLSSSPFPSLFPPLFVAVNVVDFVEKRTSPEHRCIERLFEKPERNDDAKGDAKSIDPIGLNSMISIKINRKMCIRGSSEVLVRRTDTYFFEEGQTRFQMEDGIQ